MNELTLTELNNHQISNDWLEKRGFPILEKYTDITSWDILNLRMFECECVSFSLKNGYSLDEDDLIVTKCFDKYYVSGSCFDFNVEGVMISSLVAKLESEWCIINNNIFWMSSMLIRTVGNIQDFLDGLNSNYNRVKKSNSFKTYVMYDENSGLYKIGKAINPQVREKVLSGEVPKIKLILICDKNIESALHRKYKHIRARGEWFKLSADDVLDIIKENEFKEINNN